MKTATRRRTDSGFKRSEMALVGAVLLVAIAALLPWWIQREQKKNCTYNLKQIDGAVQQWALDYKKTTLDTYSFGDPSYRAFLRGSVLPICPSGGTYIAATNIGEVPRCNIPGHTLW